MDIVAWAQGGIGYEYAKTMPLNELIMLQRRFVKINKTVENRMKQRH